MAVSLSPGTADAALYAAPAVLTVPGYGSVSSALTVDDAGSAAGLSVALFIQAVRDDAVTISLTKLGSGRSVTLASGRGGAGTLFGGTRFADDAAVWIGAGASPFVGSFRAESLLSVFAGVAAAGTWVLTVRNAGAGEDSLLGWSLDLPAVTVPEPGSLLLLGAGLGACAVRRKGRGAWG